MKPPRKRAYARTRWRAAGVDNQNENPLGTDGSWLSQKGDKLMSIVPVLAIVAAIAVVALVVTLVIRRKSKRDEDRR